MKNVLQFCVVAVMMSVFGLMMFVCTAVAQTETVLWSFNGTRPGNFPRSPLIFDTKSNLYGTTSEGGNACGTPGCGTVFELRRRAGGGWGERLLYSFKGGPGDGSEPVAGLVFDKKGNLYGTTYAGGANSNCGIVFMLTPTRSGPWKEKVLYNFNAYAGDAAQPYNSGLIFDSNGNLYGTTIYGGATGVGAVFKLSPGRSGIWKETLLYQFTGGNDGTQPAGTLTFDTNGNLYGTTVGGGGAGTCPLNVSTFCGTVFKLSPLAGGSWSETVLHSFAGGSDGAVPFAGLVLDTQGNLYGTTSLGGGAGTCILSSNAFCGTVFELSPQSGGGWAETLLHSFAWGDDGAEPISPLLFDGAGNLYGNTGWGGELASCGGSLQMSYCGIAYELTPSLDGVWSEAVLHDFGATGDGIQPGFGGLLFDANGNLYGTTGGGGRFGYGTVFEITP